ncbi:hypothetical protein A3K82_01545 [Candidatus Pacearchaeota archaeon RBG_19FT_COMBO_34_9]|nr:MAG: hypothetical protein A3K82_01545 [Candidatus Pacearchaeota archaeon RBG_19FT_COMBO_34_9]
MGEKREVRDQQFFKRKIVESKTNRYLITITGSHTHFEVPISNLDDFDDLEKILKILKKKLM